MATEGEKLRNLRDFLSSSFTASELEMFLTVNGYEDVTAAVNQSATKIEYFFAIAQALERRGLIDNAFFQRLRQERPGKEAGIRVLQGLWLSEGQAIQSPDHSTPSSMPRNRIHGVPLATQDQPSAIPSGTISERILHHVDPKVFIDFDSRVKPIFIVAGIHEWTIKEHVLRYNAGLTLVGYVCPAAIVKISQKDGALWLFVGYRSDLKQFRAARILPSLAAECLLLCGYDLPDDLIEWATPVPDPKSNERNAPDYPTALIDRVRTTSDLVPSIDHLVEIHQALWWFIDVARSSVTPTSAQESEVLPRFGRLADALRPIRYMIDHMDGWPTKVQRGLRSIIRAFDAIVQEWGWQGVVSPNPARSAFMEQRREWVRENLERPMYEAALAASAGWDESRPCPYDDLADEARRRGIVSMMSRRDGIAKFEPARARLNEEPHIGKRYPKLEEQELAEFVGAFNALHSHMVAIAPGRCARPPWQEELAARSATDISFAGNSVPEQTQAPASTATVATSDASTGCLDFDRNNTSNKIIRNQVFISYSHRDKKFRDELQTHLKPYLRKGTVTVWSDEQIDAGSKWFDEIRSALTKTAVAVLLVSPDFLASDFIHEHELGPLLKEAAAGGVTILWMLIRDCSYQQTKICDYQAVVSPPSKPFASMTKAKRDAVWRRVCEAIQRAANQHLARQLDSASIAPMGQCRVGSTGSKSRDPSVSTTNYGPAVVQIGNSAAIVRPLKVICPLHGIRTLAAWQKGLSDLAFTRGWVCRLDRWYYGRFSLVAFFMPFCRIAKVDWLRRQYDAEIHDRRLNIEQGQAPSVVAHSFGTYILGYALLRFDFIRFDKVILCGSILPTDFPWDKLIDRGQVQAVRNEYGVRDPWVKRARCLVRGTGPSGASGFTCRHERLEQEEFEYNHGDYFGIDHMEDRWIPFLNKPLAEIPRAKDGPRIRRPITSTPWCLYGVIVSLVLMSSAVIGYLITRTGTADRSTAISSALIGRLVDEAERAAESQGMKLRVVIEDGKALAVTQDYRKDRVNVETKNGRVKSIKGNY